MTRKNILYIASRTDIAGGEVYLQDVFAHLDRARFTPIVVVPGKGAFSDRLETLGIECFVSEVDYGWLKPPMPWYRFLAGLPGRVRHLSREMRARDIALVHTNSNMILEGALAARLAGVHHMTVVHIPFPGKPSHLPASAACTRHLRADHRRPVQPGRRRRRTGGGEPVAAAAARNDPGDPQRD